jgi:predicted DNA-binding transcriptional regulator
MNLNVEEWRVVSYVNPQNTIRQIAQATHLTDLEVRRVVFSLLQAGLVEIIRPGGVGGPVITGKMFPTENPDEQKSLVNKLIDRIRTI